MRFIVLTAGADSRCAGCEEREAGKATTGAEAHKRRKALRGAEAPLFHVTEDVRRD
jgi:hypothetical protein